MELIRDNTLSTGPIVDGILLFGKHSGKKISELLVSFDFSPYVTNYLSRKEDLPKEFKKQINEIIENSDPFGGVHDEINESFNVKPKPRGFSVKEIDITDDVPWSLFIVCVLLFIHSLNLFL